MKSLSAFLLLPSVKDNRFLEIKNITVEEAKDFLDLYTVKLLNNKDIQTIDYSTGLKAEMTFLHPLKFQLFFDEVDTNNIASFSLYVQVLAKIKSMSKIACHEHRYNRAVFVDLDNNVIGFGTTLFGSKNGYINYSDSSLNNELASIQSYIDNYSYQDIL
jgi:hypothetical protein